MLFKYELPIICVFLIVAFVAYMADPDSDALLLLMIQLLIMVFVVMFTPPPFAATPFWIVNPSTTTAIESAKTKLCEITCLAFFPSMIVGFFAVSRAASDVSVPANPPYRFMPEARFTTVERVVSP